MPLAIWSRCYDIGASEGMTTPLTSVVTVTPIVQSDSGIYDAMNQALTLCRGEFVQFLNAGDLYHNDGVLAHVAAEIARDAVGIDIYFADYFNLDSRVKIQLPSTLSAFYLFRNGLCHQTMFVRRKLLRSGFDVSFRLLADQDFLVREVRKNQCTYRKLDVLAIDYDGTGVSATRNAGPAHQRERRIIHRRYYSIVPRFVYQILHELTLYRLRVFVLSRFPASTI
jgi:glycosyltransferase involved in cell wall biosynthesis